MIKLRYAVPAVAVGAILALSGCSSSSTSTTSSSPSEVAASSAAPAGTTYTNEEYGYSFVYDEPFEEQPATEMQAESGTAVQQTSVFDTEQDASKDAFMVSVYEVNTEITPDKMDAVKQELESNVLPSLESSGENMQIGSLVETTVDGRPAFKTEATFTSDGTDMKSNLYFVFNGTLEYQLIEQATAATWDSQQSAFNAMRESFKITDVAGGASPSAS